MNCHIDSDIPYLILHSQHRWKILKMTVLNGSKEKRIYIIKSGPLVPPTVSQELLDEEA